MFAKPVFISMTLLLSSATAFSAEYGLSTSGKDISLNLWGGGAQVAEKGAYVTFLYDFDDYTNGDRVSVCGDGSISGSTGGGSCSGHSGVSGQKDAKFDRMAFTFGGTYNATNRIRLNAGLVVGIYSSDIDIGDESELDHNEVGFDFGVSYKVLESSDFKLSLNHETEAGKTLVGFWYPFS